MFNFPSCVAPGSPILSSHGRASELTMSPVTMLPVHCSSPRTRIRTQLGHSMSLSESLVSDYQGGKEELAESGDKSKEQLYTEAKEILAMVQESGDVSRPTSDTVNRQLTDSPAESPNSTQHRRPPRSKHDTSLDTETEVTRPSSEAASRLLIGTVMLSKGSQQPRVEFQERGAGHMHGVDTLKTERNRVLEEVNRTTKELSELSIALEEAERSVVMEQSLIGNSLL